jgi:Lon protease-like protein
MPLPLHIFEERYKLMIGECIRDSHPFGVVLMRSGNEGAINKPIYEVGTTAKITQVEHLGDGRMNISALGTSRFLIQRTHLDKPYLTGVIEDFPLLDTNNLETRFAARQVSPRLLHYLNIFAKLGNVQLELNKLPDDPITLAFMTAHFLRVPIQDKQILLSTPDLLSMLRTERKMLHREAFILKELIEKGPRWRDDPGPFSPN